MKIMVEIGHPAHAHYFRNFIKTMEARGHSVLVIARDKEMTFDLLDAYKIKYKSRGKGKDSILGKFFYMPLGIFFTTLHAIRYKPDILMSMGSPFAAIASKFVNRPHITFDDTENAVLTQFLYKPFTEVILSPSAYKKDFGEKHIKFKGYMELLYLHPNRFKPDELYKNKFETEEYSKYCIVRFVKWTAHHDVNHKGITSENKIRTIKEFSKYARVLISSEIELPESLEPYRLDIPYEKIHDAMCYTSLVFGESATMTSEAAALGTPAVYVNRTGLGYTEEEQQKYGLVFNYTESLPDQSAAIEKGIEILKSAGRETEWHTRRDKMISEKIDVTAFTVWFVENYPSSFQIMKENPEYQDKFK